MPEFWVLQPKSYIACDYFRKSARERAIAVLESVPMRYFSANAWSSSCRYRAMLFAVNTKPIAPIWLQSTRMAITTRSSFPMIRPAGISTGSSSEFGTLLTYWDSLRTNTEAGSNRMINSITYREQVSQVLMVNLLVSNLKNALWCNSKAMVQTRMHITAICISWSKTNDSRWNNGFLNALSARILM